MKKLGFWTAGGLVLALVCGLAGLGHLSATLVTLTVFCTVPALLSLFSTRAFGLVATMPDRIATWLETKGAGPGRGRG
ncbi:hypothetical protein [Sinorhizobium medicae]|jgi:hypothetical protein|uniref:hypothetical protein n=1 Tax=Sinorhizobium medicae TaxID=110321 RepID=UPI0012950669|nr:hypothetical protein [Sinorhizobium medicae]MQX78111.1 hypothetical protein [Sinorhizobium medicae]